MRNKGCDEFGTLTRRVFVASGFAAAAGLPFALPRHVDAQPTSIPQFTRVGGSHPYDVIAPQLSFPEGPVVLNDGSVLLVELFGRRLSRVLGDGRVQTVAALEGGPNGAAIGPGGLAFVTNNGGIRPYPDRRVPDDWTGGWIDRVDLSTGRVDRVVDNVAGRRLSGPNDLVFDGAGGFWFTDAGRLHEQYTDNSGIYYFDLAQNRAHEVVYPLASVNGIGLSPDRRTLYVAYPLQRQITAFELEDRGRIARRNGAPAARTLASTAGNMFFDSLKVEASGNVVVAFKGADPGGLAVVTPDGRIEKVVFGVPASNLAFGGPDMRTVYIAAGSDTNGQLLRIRWPRPGLRLAYTA